MKILKPDLYHLFYMDMYNKSRKVVSYYNDDRIFQAIYNNSLELIENHFKFSIMSEFYIR